MERFELPRFPDFESDEQRIRDKLRSDLVHRIVVFALGPEGTNIERASREWSKKLRVSHKTEIRLIDTPYHAVECAREIDDSRTFPVVVTCAVYNRLNDLYFSNHDCYLFFDHLYMKLDNMQLAARAYVADIPSEWTIASHASPNPLVRALPNTVVETTSNSCSARICSERKVDCCITTETARRKHDLVSLHSFGSPMMLFLFGTTTHGINILRSRELRLRLAHCNDFSLVQAM